MTEPFPAQAAAVPPCGVGTRFSDDAPSASVTGSPNAVAAGGRTAYCAAAPFAQAATTVPSPSNATRVRITA